MNRLRKGALAALALVFLVSGAGLAATWEPDRSVDALRARWAPPPSQFVSVRGMRVHLRDEGPREDPLPIVLLHGTSASLHTWDGWVDELAETRRVIRVDLPGFGLTGPAPDHDYRIAAYVDFVAGVTDALGVQRFVLGGNSLGGRIAWGVALEHPERVEKLILVDAGGYPLEDPTMPIGFRIAMTPGLNLLMEHVLPRAMVESSVRNVYGDPSRVSPELVDRYFELTLREGNRAALRARFAQHDFGEDAARIHEVTQPTLILWGDRDRLIAPSDARRFAQDIEGSRVVLFEGLGHVPHEEDPAATVAEVLSFL